MNVDIFGKKVKLLALFLVAAVACVLFFVYTKNNGWMDISRPSIIEKPVLQTVKELRSEQPKKAKSVQLAHLQSKVERKKLKNHSHDTPAPNTPDKMSRAGGYIVTQTYNGQMTRAIRNMIGQQCWAWSLGKHKGSVSIVEPFSSESKLVHFQNFWDALENDRLHNAVLFGEYFDVAHYNKISLKDKNSPITRWKDFLSDPKLPRNFVAVTLPSQRCNLPRNPPKNTSKVQKAKSSCFMGKAYTGIIQGLRERFDIPEVKKVCVDCSLLSHKLTLDEFREMIYGKDRDVSQFTVFMNTWRNFAFTESWLQIPTYCKMSESPTSSDRLVPSQSVATHTKLYKDKVIKSERVVAVMFRIERFLTLKVLGKSNESLSSCIEKTLKLHNQLLRKTFLSKSGTFITLDIGRFGSKLMKENSTVSKYGQNSLESIEKSVHGAIKDFYRGQFDTVEDWEDSFVDITGGVTERGYISMLQRNIAAEADCLILMGGGSYQQVAVSQYLVNHPHESSRCIHTICVADNFMSKLTQS